MMILVKKALVGAYYDQSRRKKNMFSASIFKFRHIYSYRPRLCIANIDGSGMQVIPGWRDLIWTHFGWKSDSEFTIYTYYKTALAFEKRTKGKFEYLKYKQKRYRQGIVL